MKKRGHQIKTGDNEYKISDVGTHKNEIVEKLKYVEFNDLEDMVFRLELSYTEILKIIEMISIDASTTGLTLPLGVYKFSDIILMLKSLLPDDVKVNNTIDDIRLLSILRNIKTTRFTMESFFVQFWDLLKTNQDLYSILKDLFN